MKHYPIDPKLGYVSGTFMILCKEPGRAEYIRGGNMSYQNAVHEAKRYQAEAPECILDVKREGEA